MYKKTYTITFCGDEECGKTAMIKTLLHKEHDAFHRSTLDEEYDYETSFNNKSYKLKLLDSPGNQEYRAMIQYDIKESEGILLFFDLSIGPSFVSLDEYFECFESAELGFDTPVVLVGNVRKGEH
ncbi:hypothetical protein EIN_221760, partial [Entamoeba invadens IP1]